MKRLKRFLMVLFEALEVCLGFFMLFSLVFSFVWVLSDFFLDCVFVPLSAFLGDDVSAVVLTDLFRSLFCVAVSLFSISI